MTTLIKTLNIQNASLTVVIASFGLISMLDYYTERCVTC